MTNVAKDVLVPARSSVFRTAFLYVGQGDATLMIIPDSGGRKFLLIDSNVDEKNGGIDLQRMLKDLIDDELDVFINTHPHHDHINGIEAISDVVGVNEIWHSGHVPGKNNADAYKQLEKVMKKVGDENVYELKGSRSVNTLEQNENSVEHAIGDVDYNVLAPAEYVKDEIEGETPEERYSRIHEQCGVMRFSYGSNPQAILIAGDSDRKAWEEHITEYHKDRLPSIVLGVSHHGSRTFFMEKEGDESYENHIENIGPSYGVVSAPKQNESKHDHPHDDAIKIYEKHIDKSNLLHLGENRECVIVDIDEDGIIDVYTDKKLVKEYGYSDSKKSESVEGPYIMGTGTKLDDKPMGRL